MTKTERDRLLRMVTEFLKRGVYMYANTRMTGENDVADVFVSRSHVYRIELYDHYMKIMTVNSLTWNWDYDKYDIAQDNSGNILVTRK